MRTITVDYRQDGTPKRMTIVDTDDVMLTLAPDTAAYDEAIGDLFTAGLDETTVGTGAGEPEGLLKPEPTVANPDRVAELREAWADATSRTQSRPLVVSTSMMTECPLDPVQVANAQINRASAETQPITVEVPPEFTAACSCPPVLSGYFSTECRVHGDFIHRASPTPSEGVELTLSLPGPVADSLMSFAADFTRDEETDPPQG